MAWAFLIPLGILVATFCRNKLYWLRIHRATQTLAVLLTLIGTSVIIAGVSATGGHHFYGLHTYVGVVITVLAIVQPLIAVLRPKAAEDGKEKSGLRRKWEISHKMLGIILFLLGVVNCFLGIAFKSNPSVQNILAPVLGICIFIFICVTFIFAFKAEQDAEHKLAVPASTSTTVETTMTRKSQNNDSRYLGTQIG